jgi:hypothetical protein
LATCATLGLWLAACSNGTSLSGLASSEGGHGGGKAEPQPSASPEGGNEDIHAEVPTDVTGAFLTCAVTSDQPAGRDVACAFQDPATHARLDGDATEATVVVTSAGVATQPAAATAAAPWHIAFPVPASVDLASVNVKAHAQIGGKPVHGEVTGITPLAATGAAAMEGAPSPTATPAPVPFQRIFLSHGRYQTGVSSTQSTDGFASAEEADAICQKEAEIAQRPEKDWHALIADGSVGPIARVAVTEEVRDTKDARIAAKDAFWSPTHEKLILLNASGNSELSTDTGAMVVWTGSLRTGEADASNNCGNWTTQKASDQAHVGHADDGRPNQWQSGTVEGATYPCHEKSLFPPVDRPGMHRFYCVSGVVMP